MMQSSVKRFSTYYQELSGEVVLRHKDSAQIKKADKIQNNCRDWDQ